MPEDPPVDFSQIEQAAKRISGRVLNTPTPPSIPLSEITGSKIYCKLEYLQRTGSFKERGARNALELLTPEQRKRGIIAASAGNHALALAYHGQQLGMQVTVVMPQFAPLTKVMNCQKMGAKVLSHGSNISQAKEEADRLAGENGAIYIHGFDDPAIIAGQGTMGLEMASQVPDLDAVIVPIGGGGLIAGIALALKQLKPGVQIIGVEPESAASFSASLKAGHPVEVSLQPTLADGLSVPKVGARAFALAKGLVDQVVTVSEQEIALAILRLMELEKAVVEGAGATPLAACLSGRLPLLKGKKVVLPLCGGNIDLTLLGRVLERGLVHDGRICRFTASISDRPGGLAAFARIVAEEGASILEIDHDRAFASDDISRVVVHCVLETRDFEHAGRIKQRLEREGFRLGSNATSI